MTDKVGAEKTFWDALNAVRASSPLGRINESELEAVLAALDAAGFEITPKS